MVITMQGKTVISIDVQALQGVIADVLGDTSKVEVECNDCVPEFVSARVSPALGSMADAVEIREFDKLEDRLLNAIIEEAKK